MTHDSGPSHVRVQAVAAVPYCAVYSDIRYIFHVLEDKQMLNMWTTRFVTRTRIFLGLGLGLGLRGDDSDSDSDLTTWTRTQH